MSTGIQEPAVKTAPGEQVRDHPPTLVEPDPVLIEALRLLRTKGWAQRHYRWAGRYCLVGAINVACGGRPSRVTADTEHYLRRLGLNGWKRAVRWNDNRRRTKEQVLERVERAAYDL